MTKLIDRANDISKEKKRTKVMPADIMQALSEVGFDKFNSELKGFLQNYDEQREEKREAIQKRHLEGAVAKDDMIDASKDAEAMLMDRSEFKANVGSKRLRLERE